MSKYNPKLGKYAVCINSCHTENHGNSFSYQLGGQLKATNLVYKYNYATTRISRKKYLRKLKQKKNMQSKY